MPLSRFHPLITEWFTSAVGCYLLIIKLSASDPLNLAGVILPGPRVPAVSTNFLVFRDGVVVRSVIGQKAHSGEADPGGSLPAVARSRSELLCGY